MEIYPYQRQGYTFDYSFNDEDKTWKLVARIFQGRSVDNEEWEEEVVKPAQQYESYRDRVKEVLARRQQNHPKNQPNRKHHTRPIKKTRRK